MIVAKPPNAKTLMDLMTVNVFPVIEDVDLVMLAVVIQARIDSNSLKQGSANAFLYDFEFYPCIDECLEGTSECDAYATCENTPGAYTCQCVDGFLGNGRTCQNVDECRMRVHKCHADAICHDAMEGAYDCECIEGYDGNGIECNDIDECSKNSHSCGENTDCFNIPGSYTCRCSQGFVEGHIGSTAPVDKTIHRPCFDIDECELRSHNCEGNQECEN